MKIRRSNKNLFGFILLFILLILLFIFYSYKLKESFDTNIAFYTCFYGTNNNIAFKIPEIPTEKYPCYYFTNNKDMLEDIKKTNWIGVYDNKPVTEDLIDSCFYGKKVKVVPHDFKILKNYNYTIFFDSKMEKINITFIEDCIQKYFVDGEYALVLREHDFIHDNIWNEYDESILQERYLIQKDRYINYINKQISNGLSENTQNHAQCNLLIRNMNHPKIKEIDHTWYSHIEECGIQDQISFFFVKQIFDEYILTFNTSPFVKK